jgi:hypothetical protein
MFSEVRRSRAVSPPLSQSPSAACSLLAKVDPGREFVDEIPVGPLVGLAKERFG